MTSSCKNRYDFRIRVLSLVLVCLILAGFIIPPAEAMSAICGISEHTHTEECYAVYGDEYLDCDIERLNIHKHEAGCYDEQQNVTCWFADFVLHKHVSECYDASGEIICPIPEADSSIHGLDYDNIGNVTCVYKPYFAHVHGSGCYRTESELVCEIEPGADAHVHDDSCYERRLTCGLDEIDIETEIPETPESPETDGQQESGDAESVPTGDSEVEAVPEISGDEVALQHVHDDTCYSDVLVCELNTTGHEHNDDCYIKQDILDCDVLETNQDEMVQDGMQVCQHYTYEEHQHESSCYDKTGKLSCGKWELKSHEHNATCFSCEILSYDSEIPTCGKDEHKHSVTCYFEDKTEELDTFLSAYEKFDAEILSGRLNPENEEDAEILANAAYQVLELSKALNKDVLKLDSVQEMLAVLKAYIPEGFVGDVGDTMLPEDDEVSGDVIANGVMKPKFAFEIVKPLDEQEIQFTIDVELISQTDSSSVDLSNYPWKGVLEVGTDGVLEGPEIKFSASGEHQFRVSMTDSSGNALIDDRDWTMAVTVVSNEDIAPDEGPDETAPETGESEGLEEPASDESIDSSGESAGEGEAVPDETVDESEDVDNGEIGEGESSEGSSGETVPVDFQVTRVACNRENSDDIFDSITFMIRPGVDVMPQYSNSVRMQARRIMSGMTQEQMAGQMLLPHFSQLKDSDAANPLGCKVNYEELIKTYHVGGLILFANDTNPANISSNDKNNAPNVLRNILKNVQQLGKTANNNIGMLISVDEEGGLTDKNVRVNRVSMYSEYGKSPYLSSKEMYRDGGFDLIREQDADKAKFLLDLGFNMTHAPVLDLAKTGYMAGRAFSDDPLDTAEYATLSIRALSDNGIGISMKHFPGYGNTTNNTHDSGSYNDLSEDVMQYADLVPFYAGMAVGGDTLMVTHNGIGFLHPDEGINIDCASCDPKVYALARSMGFDGIIMTDDLNMSAVTSRYEFGAVAALQAGADIALVGDMHDIRSVVAAVKSGEIPASRVRESVERILCWKIEHGLISDESDTPTVPVGVEAEWLDLDGTRKLIGSFADVFGQASRSSYGGTVRLLADVASDSLHIEAGDVFTLDLNGHVLTLRESDTIAVRSKFVLMDSVTDGIDMVTSRAASLPNGASGFEMDRENFVASWYAVDDAERSVKRTLDLSEAGRIEFVGHNVEHVSGANIDVVNGGTFEFRSGVITGTTSFSSFVYVDELDGIPSALILSGGWFFGIDNRYGTSVVHVSHNVGRLSIHGGGVVGCTVSGSSDDGWYWPVIYANAVNISLSDVYFIGNESSGSVVLCNNWWSSDEYQVPASGCEFAWNVSGNTLESGSCSIVDSKFVYNTVYDSGSLYVIGRTVPVTISNCIFVFNGSDEAVAGAICFSVRTAGNVYNVNIAGSTFANNVSSVHTGGIADIVFDSSVGGIHVVSDCSFVSKQYAVKYVGGDGRLTFSDCDVQVLDTSGLSGVWFNANELSISDVRFSPHVGIRPFSSSTACRIGGFVDFDVFVDMTPSNRFVVTKPLDSASRIRFSFGYDVSIDDEILVALAGTGVDLSNSVDCFVPPEGMKVWYDPMFKQIKCGLLEHEIGTGSTASGVTLQYYANIKVADTSSASESAVRLLTIDNSVAANKSSNESSEEFGMMRVANGGYLPRNKHIDVAADLGSAWTLRSVFLDDNNDDGIVVASTLMPVPIYSSRQFGESFDSLDLLIGHKLSEFNVFSSDAGVFDLDSIWILRPDKSMDSLIEDDFDIIPYSPDLYFTDDATNADSNAILLKQDMCIRFMAKPVTTYEGFQTVFYDYDVTDSADSSIATHPSEHRSGLVGREYVPAGHIPTCVFDESLDRPVDGLGINSSANYIGSGAHFAFGNANLVCPTCWQNAKRGDFFINRANRVQKDNAGTTGKILVMCFKYCHFGIVTGLDDAGNLIWADDVAHQNLFNDGPAKGKTTYANSELVFQRVGNTFTLESVRGYDADSPRTPDGQNLRTFGNYSGAWANNFWPMDAVHSAGGAGHDPMFGKHGELTLGGYSDDGQNHNSYFGMHFSVQFQLEENYIAPMSYQFFGDDDLWVFLDGQLICDLGGVHPSAGQYVDLRDYLPVGSIGTHKLSVYYLERGASGSSCWMQMNLPNSVVTSTDVPEDVEIFGDLRIVKSVEGLENCSDTFNAKVEIFDKAGSLVSDMQFDCVGLGDDKTSIASGDEIALSVNQPVEIKHIPVGYRVRVTELLGDTKFWTLISENNSDYIESEIEFGSNELELVNQYHPGGRLLITKSVVDGQNNSMLDCAENFLFTIELYEIDGVNPIREAYDYRIYHIGDDFDTAMPVASGVLQHKGPSIAIPANCVLVSDYFPKTVRYVIQELAADTEAKGYQLIQTENESGVIDWDVQEATFVNGQIGNLPKLPSAGGIGIWPIYWTSLGLVGLALILEIRRKKKQYA